MSAIGSCDTVSCQLQYWCCYLHRLGLFVVQDVVVLGLLLLCIAYDYHTSFENLTQLVSKSGSLST